MIAGIFFIIISILSAYAAFSSFMERQSHGSGPLFADVEMLVIITIIFAILGSLTIFTSRKILRLGSKEKK